MSLISDERGKASAMRALLFYVAVPVLALMTLAGGFLGIEFPAAAWTVWGSLATMLTVGSFGPRIAQYLAPQIGSAVAVIRDAAIAKRRAQGGDHEVTP